MFIFISVRASWFLPFSGYYLLTEKYFRCLIACEKVKPLSSSMSFWDFVTQISSLETSSWVLLNISHIKQKQTVETFPLLLFDAIFCIVGFNHSKLQVYILSTCLFYQFYIKELIEVWGLGWGRTVGKKMSGNRKQKRCFMCLMPVGAFQIRKGSWSYLIAESDRELISPVEFLVCSGLEEMRLGRSFFV